MRRFAIAALAVATLLFLVPAAQSHAQGHYGQGSGSYHGGGGWHGGGWHGGWHGGGYHGGTGVVIGVAPGWGYGWGWGPGWFYPPPFYYGYGAGYYGVPYGGGPPVVVQQPAPEYIQQEPQQESLPSGYWYYCASARDYYPSVPSCPEAWIQVPPTPERR
jgi:hypothetical protein